MIRVILILISLLFSVMGYYYYPFYSSSKEFSNIITFLGILSAAIIPAMIFTAGIKPNSDASVEYAKKLEKAITEQMQFWILFFCTDIIACILIIIGEIIEWKIHIIDYDLSWLIKSTTIFFVVFTILEIIELLRGILSFQKVNIEAFMESIYNQKKHISEQFRLNKIDIPDNYGHKID